METRIGAKATLRQRAVHEFKELAVISLYLYVTLGAMLLLKAAILHDQGIEFAPWGTAIIKSVVLAKFMLLGHAIKLGEHKTIRPLIWPTLYMAFAFLVLLVVLTVVEEAIVGLLHHKSIAASLGDLFSNRLEETIANIVILLLVLIPYFAFRVLGDALGEGRLERMFFVDRETTRQG